MTSHMDSQGKLQAGGSRRLAAYIALLLFLCNRDSDTHPRETLPLSSLISACPVAICHQLLPVVLPRLLTQENISLIDCPSSRLP